MVKDEAGLEEYTRSLVGQEELRLRFRLRTGSAGLFEDKKRCRMCDDERCVLCNSGEVEDVEHFLVRCEEFRWDRQVLLEKIRQIEGTQGWIDEYGRVGGEGKMALLLGRSVKSLEREVGDRVNECIMRKWWQRRNWFTVEVPMNLDLYKPQTPPPLTISNHVMVVIIIHLYNLSRLYLVLYLCCTSMATTMFMYL